MMMKVVLWSFEILKSLDMRKTIVLFSVFLFLGINFSSAQKKAKKVEPTDPKQTEVWTPVPVVVTPGQVNSSAPSDAVVIFDGTNTDAFEHLDGSPIKWTLNGDGSMTVTPKSGDIRTKASFGSFQLHIEWRTPSVVKGEGQGRGNSGIFLQDKYEVQVLDSYNNLTYSNGQASSIYKQTMPLVNACRPPGEWQSYDIIYKAPKFNKKGVKTSSAYVTVIQNGILTHNNTKIQGTTPYIGWPKNPPHEDGPLKLQDHGDLVSYRNIWLRKL
jgi:hypothetical protein